jgi:hypothetical protein
MGRRREKKRFKIHWRRVAAVLAAFFLTGLAFAYWMLAGIDLNRFKPEIVAAVKTATGRELHVGGDIQVKLGVRPTLAVEDVRFQNASWASRRDMLRLKRLEFQIAAWPLLFGKFDIRRVVFVAPDLLLETSADGVWNLPKLRPRKKKAQSVLRGFPVSGLQHLTFAAARIEGGRLAWRNERTGKTSALIIKTAKAGMTDLESPIRFTMQAAYRGRNLRVAGSIGRLFRLLDETLLWPADVSITAKGLQATVAGTIRSVGAGRGVDLSFQLKGDSLAELGHYVPILPSMPKGAFSATFRLTDPSDGHLRFSDLQMTVGQSDFSGWLEFVDTGRRPCVNAELHSRNIVLESRPKKAPKPASAAANAKVFSSDPIDFGGLKKFDAKVHLTADRLQSPTIATEKVDLNLSIEGGEAYLRPVLIQIGGGFAELRATIRPSARDAWVSLRLTARDLPVERVMTLFTRAPLLVGKMDADVQLLGSGGSVAALMSGADGKIFGSMGSGKIRTRYIDQLAGEAAGSVVRLLGSGSKDPLDIDLNCLVAEIDVARGVAHCRGLLLDTDRTTIAGQGTIDLSSEKIDVTMDPSPKRGIGVKGLGGLTLSLGEAGNPFKLGGTLGSPQVILDTAGAAITIGKALGGFTLAGPLGLAAALADFSSDGGNPCLKAIAAHKKKASGSKKPQR